MDRKERRRLARVERKGAPSTAGLDASRQILARIAEATEVVVELTDRVSTEPAPTQCVRRSAIARQMLREVTGLDW